MNQAEVTIIKLLSLICETNIMIVANQLGQNNKLNTEGIRIIKNIENELKKTIQEATKHM